MCDTDYSGYLIINRQSVTLFSLFSRRAKTYSIEFRSHVYLFSPQSYHLILQDVCSRRPEIGNSWIGNHCKIRSLCVYETGKTETWCHVGKGRCPKRYIEFSIPRAYGRNETLEEHACMYTRYRRYINFVISHWKPNGSDQLKIVTRGKWHEYKMENNLKKREVVQIKYICTIETFI